MAGVAITGLSITVAFSGYYWVEELSTILPSVPIGANGSLFLRCAEMLYIAVSATGLIMIFIPLTNYLMGRQKLTSNNQTVEVKEKK